MKENKKISQCHGQFHTYHPIEEKFVFLGFYEKETQTQPMVGTEKRDGETVTGGLHVTGTAWIMLPVLAELASGR